MNKKKWQAKFAGRDSQRFLKHHPPYYGDKYRFGAMPPVEQWLPRARAALRRVMKAGAEEPISSWAYGESAEKAALFRISAKAEQEKAAVAAAIRETGTQNPQDFRLCRAVAWHLGIHYNHVGRNHFGHSRKNRGLNR